MSKPVVIDLCCGLGGWSRAFLDEGWDAIGFDVERHEYATPCPMCKGTGFCNGIPDCLVCDRKGSITKRYPGHLILADVLTLNGYDLRAANPALVVASPPCTEYSYMAMPFSRGKQIAAALRGKGEFPEGYTGSRTLAELTALYRACFRIARELGVPIVLENVKGAQPWVGRAKANYGSYYLWGDVANIGGRIVRPDRLEFGAPAVKALGRVQKQEGRNFHFPEKYGIPSPSFHGAVHEASVAAALALKTVGHANIRDGYSHTRHLTNQRESDSVKQAGLSDPAWFDGGMASKSSRSDSRKAASALIAEIPYDLAQHIARVFKP